MTFREMRRDRRPNPQPPMSSLPATDQAAREDGHAFLSAASSAIARVMSGDAREFLRQNRQQSGQ